MEKQGARRKNPRAGLELLFVLKGKLQEKGKKKRTPPYIDNGNGSHNLKIQLG